MALDCSSIFFKYTLCVINFLLFWAGGVAMGVGIWIAADHGSFLKLMKFIPPDHLDTVIKPAILIQGAYILIAVGVLVFIVSFLAYCGAIKESRVLLSLYGSFVVIIIILELTAVGIAYTNREQAENTVKKFMHSSLEQYYLTSREPKANPVNAFWDLLQVTQNCCGINNFTDFKETPWYSNRNDTNILLPHTCCKMTDTQYSFELLDITCPTNPTDSNSYRMQGCFEKVKLNIISNEKLVIGIGSGLAIFQLIAVIFAFCLCHAIGSDYIK